MDVSRVSDINFEVNLKCYLKFISAGLVDNFALVDSFSQTGPAVFALTLKT